MRLLLLTFYYEPDLCAGSFRSGALVRSLLGQMSDCDTLEVVTTHPNRYSTYHVESLAEERQGNLTIRRISIPRHKSGICDQAIAFLIFFLNALLYVSRREYDIVFATSSRLFTGFLGAIIARRKRLPFYLDVRDMFLDTIESVYRNSRMRLILPVLSRVEQYTLRAATRVSLVSEGFLPYYSDKCRGQCAVFSNGIDDEFLTFREPARQFRHDGELVLTYTGNIGEGQGLEKIVPGIAHRYRNIRIVIVGDGSRKESLRSACSNFDNVRILPPVSREEIVKLYETSDAVFLHLNDYDAFRKVLPSKIFEYGASFKPIIAGVDGYASEFIRKYLPDATVFKPCDCEDFCRQFSSFNGYVDIERRREFIRNFSREKIMREMARDILALAPSSTSSR